LAAAAASALNDAAVPSTTNKSKAEAAVPSTAKKPKVAEKKAADKPPALKNSTNEPSPAAVVKEAPQSSDVASSSEAISALKKVLSKAGTPQELAKKLATALATDPVAVPELCNTIADIVNEAKKAPAASLASVKADPTHPPVQNQALPSTAMLTTAPVGSVSLLQPRGKFELCLHPSTVLFKGKTSNIVIDAANIDQMLFLPHPPPAQGGGAVVDAKKALLFICFKAPIVVGKSSLSSIAMSLDVATKISLKGSTAPLPESLEGNAPTVISKGIAAVVGKEWVHPSPKYFTSVKGDSCVKAYVKANEGLLFLLPSGLVWTKPMSFIPAGAIQDVEFNPGSSTIELVVSVADASVKGFKDWEFGMIEAAEQAAIAKYFKKMSKKGRIERKCSTESEGEEGEQNEEEEAPDAEAAPEASKDDDGDDSMSSDDDEYDPDKSEDEGEEEGNEDEGDDGEDDGATDSEDDTPTKRQKTK